MFRLPPTQHEEQRTSRADVLPFRRNGNDRSRNKRGETHLDSLDIAYNLRAGLFRVRCLNSLVTQIGTIDVIKVCHSGDVQATVIEGTYSVLKEAERTLTAPQDWAGLRLKAEEQAILAEAAHLVRFGDSDGETTAQVISGRFSI